MEKFLNPNDAHLYLIIVFSLINATMLICCSYKYLQILQLSRYHARGVFAWMKESKNKYTRMLFASSILGFTVTLILNFVFIPFEVGQYLSYLGLGFYFMCLLYFILNNKRVPLKKPLKYTKRMYRLSVFMLVFLVAISFGLFLPFCTNDVLRFLFIPLTPLLLPVVTVVSNWIMYPVELIIKEIYILIAKKKLSKYDHLIKIGITGSYGKTSTKYILRTILSEKYNVLITPHSFNTPMGIVKVLRSMLQPNHQIFIAEMGATAVGDIKFICNFVKPKYGIITNVGNQHLETFGSLSNIKKTKKELADSIPDDGFCVFNLSNIESADIFEESTCNKVYTKINDDKAFVTATDVDVDKNGTTFNIVIENKKPFKVNMSLLGEHNIQNVLEAVAIAYKLGLSVQQIKTGLSKLKPVKHRLELVNLNNGAVMLDDSFNSNIVGTKSALDVLEKFKQKNKIVITPGLVELGNREMIENLKLGKNIAKVATKVFIVNKVHKDILTKGLISGGFDMMDIVYVDNFKQAWDMVSKSLSKDDVILVENDLPDNYV